MNDFMCFCVHTKIPLPTKESKGIANKTKKKTKERYIQCEMSLHLTKSNASLTGMFCAIAFTLKLRSFVSKTTLCRMVDLGGDAATAATFDGCATSGTPSVKLLECNWDKLDAVNNILSSLLRCSIGVAPSRCKTEQSRSVVNAIDVRMEPFVVA